MRTQTILRKSGQILAVVLATAIGLYPVLYFLWDSFGILPSKGDVLLASIPWNFAFYVHIVCGGLALLTGWAQFNQKIRRERPVVHRRIGKWYVMLALCSSLSAGYLAFYANGGIIAMAGFFSLACVWFSSTWQGYVSIRKGQLDLHRKAMMISYATCFAAVTLRLWMPVLMWVYHDFTQAYVIVAWLCWVPNVALAYFFRGIAKTF